jgi:hemolysin III
MHQTTVKYYPPLEEKINIISHAVGLVFSILGLLLLTIDAFESGHLIHLIAYLIYGTSMVVLFTASTVYHRAKVDKTRSRLRIFDHAAIYVLIAGTYTPFMLLVMPGTLGYAILAAAWTMALVGIVLKIFYTGRFTLLSTSLYVLMGWAIVFAIKPLSEQLPEQGLIWLMVGGIAYTIGAILYAIKSIPFNHAIFHVFVLLGAASHFMTVYFFT